MIPCRGCSTPIFRAYHCQLCSACWDRVLNDELLLNMGPQTREEAELDSLARIPRWVTRFERIAERAMDAQMGAA